MKNKTWSRIKVQGLLRHRGGEYYARLYVSGKEKWVHLKTQHLEVAKARIEEEKKAIAAVRKVGWAVKKGVVPMNEAVKAYEEHLRLRVGLKESTRQYYGWVLKAILKSWPELLEMEIPAVTENDCKEWARGFSKEYSPLYYNTAVLILNELFKMAIKTGAIYRNPAEGVELRKKPQRKLELPTRERFRQVVDFVAAGKHRTAKLAANLIEFLAYTGCRGDFLTDWLRRRWRFGCAGGLSVVNLLFQQETFDFRLRNHHAAKMSQHLDFASINLAISPGIRSPKKSGEFCRS